MRQLILLLIGLAVGSATTLIGMNYLRQGTAYPNGVMAVMAAQMKYLDGAVKQNRCAATDTIPHVRTLRAMANDLEMAFPGIADDSRFKTHTSQFRADLDAALSAPPTDCAAAGALVEKVGTDCKACHQDFRG